MKLNLGKNHFVEIRYRKVRKSRAGRPSLDLDTKAIFEMHNQGMSLREIAEKTAASKSTIDRILKNK